jgi:hypothetical protein
MTAPTSEPVTIEVVFVCAQYNTRTGIACRPHDTVQAAVRRYAAHRCLSEHNVRVTNERNRRVRSGHPAADYPVLHVHQAQTCRFIYHGRSYHVRISKRKTVADVLRHLKKVDCCKNLDRRTAVVSYMDVPLHPDSTLMQNAIVHGCKVYVEDE